MLLACPHCDATNRIVDARFNDAPTCGRCAQELTRGAPARHADLLFAKVDTEASPQLSQRLAIRSIPTLALFRDGQVLDRLSGALPAPQFDQWLRQTLMR